MHVHELSRLGRSIKDLLQIVERIFDAGASMRFHKEGLNFEGNKTDPRQQLMLDLLSSIAQFEHDLLLSRQCEGIAITKEKGKQSRFTDIQMEQISLAFQQCTNKAELAKKGGSVGGYLYKIANNKNFNVVISLPAKYCHNFKLQELY